MQIYLILTVLCSSLLGLVVYLATKNGNRAAQLEAIKAELQKIAKEQERANEIHSNVSNLDKSAVYSLLQKTGDKQR